jgi:protease I
MASDPPQQLLGGLNIALISTRGSAPDQLQATKASLEESGVNVRILSLEPAEVGEDQVGDQQVQVADADAFDGAVVLGGAAGVQKLKARPEVLDFLRKLDAEQKPLAALGEGVALLGELGGAQEHRLAQQDTRQLEAFHAQLKQLLAQRRRDSFATVADNISSSVGEDG